MISLAEARERVMAAAPRLAPVRLPLDQADGLFLAEDVTAALSLPPFDNSSMDGYAVVAGDTAPARRESPVELECVGELAAGDEPALSIGPGQCARVFTGSPLPTGCDAVVMQEDTERREGRIAVLDSVRPWENIRFRGEDIKPGNVLAGSGSRLTAPLLAVCASCGIQHVNVGRVPRVALLATGNELVEPGGPLQPGRIYESNRLMLSSLLRSMNVPATVAPIVPDNLEATTEALRRAFEDHEFVITSGGVSVGDRDFVKAAFEALGGRMNFWKVAVKPGKPFVLGELNGRLLFGLPGNPVSAFVTFLMLARPALLHAMGAANVDLESFEGVLAETLINPGDRPHFIRVKSSPAGIVSAGTQASHVLSSLKSAEGLVEIPARERLEAGARVRVLRW